MKTSTSFLFVLICTVVLAAHQSQAKKGCNAYGHACYGGHGKRSLGSLVGGGGVVGGGGGGGVGAGSEQGHLPSDAIIQILPNEESVSLDGDVDVYPRYRLIKIIKSWFNDHPRQPADQRFSAFDYPLSVDDFNRDNSFN